MEPQNTTIIIDIDQTNSKYAIDNLNCGEYNKERRNLVEKPTRNQSDVQ